jgi:Protein of unknown function (DUF2973)
MVLHLLYIIAFTILAVLAVSNMIRNMISLSVESQKSYAPRSSSASGTFQAVPHPEFLDASGKVISEPLLVMRSLTVEDAREQLDALYESSPGPSNTSRDFRED